MQCRSRHLLQWLLLLAACLTPLPAARIPRRRELIDWNAARCGTASFTMLHMFHYASVSLCCGLSTGRLILC